MTRVRLFCVAILLVGCSLLVAQDEDKVASGPKAGAFLPASFPCLNINGPSKGKPHSLTGKFALSPSVLIFAKEPEEGKDTVFNDLLKQLDETAAEFTDRNFSVGVVFLSPDARDSSNNPKADDAKDLIKEAVDREKLIERLDKRGKDLKHVIIACYPAEGPPKYNINPKAELTVLFYERMKVVENYAFAPEKLEAKDVEKIVKRVRDALPLRKKKVEG